ncbi:MAG: VWA domain-containing protein, partial [Micromonosporaceae bacterium]|nr:VWA domain-containing protein [Micromonosporaceae bacterium]
GNILPGERISVTMTLAGVLAVEDGEATFRFPLVVAPRYIPGRALEGAPVGSGLAMDTDAVPDASRITPPVLLPGLPNPVRLSIDVGIDPAGLPLGTVRSSLHAVTTSNGRVRIRPGERVNRDFVLRLAFGAPEAAAGLVVVPDATEAAALAVYGEGTFQLTVMPPESDRGPRPRDVVLLLDRSGSMEGWKMVAARRAAARIVDTLTDADRFAVLAFDTTVEQPAGLPEGLVAATDRYRYRAVEHLARTDARGGTVLLEPLRRAAALLSAGPAGRDERSRDRVIVLVTDGQVGNEDQILAEAGRSGGLRIHTVGIDQAVNAGFLGRLAALGGGRCELVESEYRLDTAMDRIHRRIGSPLVTGVRVVANGTAVVPGTRTPDRLPDVFPGVPYVVRGRYTGAEPIEMTVAGSTPDGREWSVTASAMIRSNQALAAIWARSLLRDMEDAYVALGRYGEDARKSDLERRIVDLSLRFGVLCRFTAYVAIEQQVVTDGEQPRQIIQPVEPAAGWDMLGAGLPPSPMQMAPMAMMVSRASAPGAASPGAASRGHAGPADLRTLAATEANRLRLAQGEPWYLRRDILADLGTRLAAIARGDGPGHAALRQLADLLSMDRLDVEGLGEAAIDRLWLEALRVLDELSAEPGGHRGSGRGPSRRPFWKR